MRPGRAQRLREWFLLTGWLTEHGARAIPVVCKWSAPLSSVLQCRTWMGPTAKIGTTNRSGGSLRLLNTN